jgi:hypothetical protein
MHGKTYQEEIEAEAERAQNAEWHEKVDRFVPLELTDADLKAIAQCREKLDWMENVERIRGGDRG